MVVCVQEEMTPRLCDSDLIVTVMTMFTNGKIKMVCSLEKLGRVLSAQFFFFLVILYVLTWDAENIQGSLYFIV